MYVYVCVCFFSVSSHLFWTTVDTFRYKWLHQPGLVTQEAGQAQDSPPSLCGASLNILSRERAQPSRSFPRQISSLILFTAAMYPKSLPDTRYFVFYHRRVKLAQFKPPADVIHIFLHEELDNFSCVENEKGFELSDR